MLNFLKSGMGKALLTLMLAGLVGTKSFAGDPPPVAACYSGTAGLSGDAVVPAVETTSVGFASFEVNTNDNIIYALVIVLLNESNETAAGLYLGEPGMNGMLLTNLPMGAVKAVTYTYSESDETALLAGNFYVQIASNVNPDGELRGQLGPPAECDASANCRSFVEFSLSGDQMVPAVETGASGTATITVNRVTNQLEYNVQLSDLTNTEVSAEIIGYNGFGLPLGSQLALSLPLGNSKQGFISLTSEQAFFIFSGVAAVVIKTDANPDGEIRGNFGNLSDCVAPTATETPTPTETPSPTPTPSIDYRALGDFDASGCTDLSDFLFLLDNWQTVSPLGGAPIGLDDFLALLDNWQSGPGC